MKKLIFIVFLITYSQVCSFAQKHGRSPVLGYYPESYNQYTSSSWNAMKAIFEKAKSYKNVDYLRNDPNTRIAVWYLYGRITDIEWNKEQKKEIISYLDFFARNFHSDDKRENHEDHFHLGTDPSNYPFVSTWAVLKLDFMKGCEMLEENSTRFGHAQILGLLSEHYNNINFENCVNHLMSIIEFDKKSIKQIESLKFNHRISLVQNQSEAWEQLLQRCQDTLKFKELNSLSIWDWYNVNLLMNNIHEEIDIASILDIANRKKSMFEKYLMLYSAASFINNYQSQNRFINGTDLREFKRQVNNLYQANTQNFKDINNIDALNSGYQLIIKRNK